MTKIGKLNKW